MKGSQLVFMFLLIGLIWTAFGLMVNDFEQQYVDTNISNTEPLNDTYRQAFVNWEDVNETFDPLVRDIEPISSGQGFIFIEGLIALPAIAFHLPGAIFSFLGIAKDSLFTMFQLLGIPPAIVAFVSIFLTIMVIFIIIEFLKSYPV